MEGDRWTGMGHHMRESSAGLMVPEHVLRESSDTPSLSQPIAVRIGPEGETEPVEEPLPIENQGDLITGNVGGEPVILPVGATDGAILTVDPTAPDGIAWQEPIGAPGEGTGEEHTTTKAEGGFITLSAPAKLILCFGIAWGKPAGQSITALFFGGSEMSGTGFGNVVSLGGGPFVTQSGIQGSWSPGKYSIKATINAEATKVPIILVVFAFTPPGTVNRTGTVSGESETTEPGETFLLTTSCWWANALLVRRKVEAKPATVITDTNQFTISNPLFNLAGEPTGVTGIVSSQFISYPPNGNHNFQWTYPEKALSKVQISNLKYS